MADLAQLGIIVDSTSVKTGVGELDKLTAAGARAEGAVNKLGGTTKAASVTASEYAANAQRMAANATLTGTATTRLGAATTLAARSTRVLSTEIGVLSAGLATGSVGAQGLATSLGRISIAALLLMPALGGVVATAGLALLAFKGMKDEAADDKELKKFIGTLGLTRKEIKRLEDVTVTWGDVGRATFEVLAERAGTSASEITSWFDWAFRKIGEFGKFSIAIIYGAFVAGAKGIVNVWNAVPAVIGEAAVSAANAALSAIESMVNVAVQKINGLIASVNMLPFVNLPAVAAASFGQIEDKWAGTTRKLGETLDADFHSAFDSAMGFFGDVSDRATDLRKKNLRGQADEMIGDRADKAAKKEREKKAALSEAEKAYRAAMKAAQDYLDALTEETDKIGKSAVEIKRMDVAMAAAAARQAAAVAPTKAGTEALLAQADAIVKAGAAWEMVYKSDQISQFIKDTVEALEFETSLLSKNADEQMRLRGEREATAAGIERGTEAWIRNMEAISAASEAEHRLGDDQQLLDMLDAAADRANVIANAMSSAFGNIGAGLGNAIGALSDYAAIQAKIDLDHKKAMQAAGKDAKALANEQVLYAKKSGTAQMQATMQVVGGLKSMFKEHSAGYKAMEAAERAFAIIQMIQTAKSVAAGAAKMFASLGPFAFPAVAAMLAVMAALGFAGGGGGSSGPSIPTAEDVQAGQGAGSVLGDAKAKSNSIANSLEIVAANSNRDLEYSNDMLKSLRSIDFSIGKLAGTIARQIQVSGGMFDTSGLSLGTKGSSGFLGLFGSTTTKSLWDSGLNLGSGSVADIIANGIAGSTYQVVQKVKKKSGFLGIGGGTKTSYTTTTGAVDPEITNAIRDVIASLRSGILSAADVIGLQGAQALLDSFQVSIGKISFKDMTGEQIEETLNAVFSKIGDDMSRSVFPALGQLQKVGEGLFETFMRVAREYQVVDVALRSIGMEFGAVGIGSVAARDALVQLFGTLDDFVEATSFFGDNFLTAAERIAPIAASVRAEMERLGLVGITTRDQFKAAVLGLDLTTTAGREMYAALLAVAPAFDKVLDYFDQANKATIDGLKSTADQFNNFASSLRKYRDTLFATDAAQGNAYATLKARFVTTAALASTGDATALGGLETSGKAFLDAARGNASSLLQYQRDVALVARGVDQGIFAAESVADYAELQLAALQNSVSILASIDSNIAALTGAVTGGVQGLPTPVAGSPVGVAPSPTSPTSSQDSAIVGELRALRQEQQASNLQIAENTSQLTRMWSRIDGDGLLIRTDEDTPVHTQAV